MTLTRKQVSEQFGVSIVTVINWSNGFYYRGKKKVFYFESKDHLHFTRTELGQPRFRVKDVKKWVNRLGNT